MTRQGLDEIKAMVEALKPLTEVQESGSLDVEALAREVAKLVGNGNRESGPIRVDRDERGLVTALNGRGVQRDPSTNLITGIE